MWCEGTWEKGIPARIEGLSNDSRTLAPDELFVALKTASRDGHDFLEAALGRGACGALVERSSTDCELPQLRVANVEVALAALSRGFRSEWTFPVVGVTGSCGKTTCKDLLSLALGREHVISTKGNLNNLIGVPMSMLRPEAAAARFGVFEAGISLPGEMARLAAMIRPDFVVFTSIGPAHLEALRSEALVAQEKGLLAEGVPAERIFMGESCAPYVELLGGSDATIVWRDSNLQLPWSFRSHVSKEGYTRMEQRVGDRIESFLLKGSGGGLASNAALAVAVARNLGIEQSDIEERFLSWNAGKLRGEWKTFGPTRVYLDCYNANPLSMEASLAVFAAGARVDLPRFYILGGMEELGENSESYHLRLGEKIPFRKGDFLLVIGPQSKSVLRGMKNAGNDMDGCDSFDRWEEARDRLKGFEGDVFLKGSRRYQLEKIFEGSKEEAC